MKKYLLVIALLSGIASVAQAQTSDEYITHPPIGYIMNRNGGHIEIYSDTAPSENSHKCFIAKTYGGGAPDQYGCWAVSGEQLMIRWEGDLDTYTYPLVSLRLTDYGRKFIGEQ